MTRERAAAKIDSAQHFVTASYFFDWQIVIFLDESFSISVYIYKNLLFFIQTTAIKIAI